MSYWLTVPAHESINQTIVLQSLYYNDIKRNVRRQQTMSALVIPLLDQTFAPFGLSGVHNPE